MDLKLKRAALTAVLALAAAAPAMQQAAAAETPQQRAASYAALGKLPDWEEGVWQIDWAALFGAGGRPEPPALTPEAAAKLAAFRANMKNGENVQNQNANCIPPGTPQIMQMPYPLEFIYEPGRVTIAIETDSQVRRVYLNAKHPDDPDPSFNGDSVGHWEGDTLVVDTTALDPATEISAGVGHTDKMHMTERFRLKDADHMEIATTIEDPKVLTQPWTVVRPYIRHRDWRIREYVCEQNNHDSADEKGRAGFRLEDEPAKPASPSAH
jgi:hypothetical protein